MTTQSKYPKIIYFGSPFLPEISFLDVIEIENVRKTRSLNLLISICLQAGHVAESQNRHQQNIEQSIKNSFNCQTDDILLFFIGATTLPILIASAIQWENTSTKTVFKNLSTPTSLKYMQQHNQYKITRLTNIYQITSNKPAHHFPQTVSNALKYLNNNSFVRSDFYNAGVESGAITLTNLFNMHQKHYPAT